MYLSFFHILKEFFPLGYCGNHRICFVTEEQRRTHTDNLSFTIDIVGSSLDTEDTYCFVREEQRRMRTDILSCTIDTVGSSLDAEDTDSP